VLVIVIIGNILGFIASIVGLGYFKSNNKDKVCIFSIIMCSFQIASMFVLGAFSGLVVVTCNILRAILTRLDKWNKYYILLFTCIITGFTIYFYKTPLDFLSVIGASLNNIGFLLMQKGKIKPFRWLRFCGNIMWVSYYGYILNFASMTFEIAYTIINLREIFRKKKEVSI
jgi:hypothetical protein